MWRRKAVPGIALIGVGRIAQKYLKSITTEKVPGAKLIAVCDTDEQKAAAYGKKYGVPAYRNAHHMLEVDGRKIDLLAILTPSGHHAKQVMELAQYGKHIVVEKPMALTLTDADAMIHACNNAGVRLFVVKQNRYNVPVRKLKEAVKSDRFGKMVMGTVRVRWCRKQAYYDETPWRGTWKQDGGVFANQAIHHIDLLQWMMGPVESVYAKSSTRLVNVETEDTGVAILKFVSGALGVVEATTATRPVDLEGSLSILGEKGAVEIGGFFANEMKTWNFEGESPEENGKIINTHRCNPEGVYAYSHVEYLKEVVNNIIHNQSSTLVDGIAGRKSLELVQAIYQSIETEREVFINFSPKHSK